MPGETLWGILRKDRDITQDDDSCLRDFQLHQSCFESLLPLMSIMIRRNILRDHDQIRLEFANPTNRESVPLIASGVFATRSTPPLRVPIRQGIRGAVALP